MIDEHNDLLRILIDFFIDPVFLLLIDGIVDLLLQLLRSLLTKVEIHVPVFI